MAILINEEESRSYLVLHMQRLYWNVKGHPLEALSLYDDIPTGPPENIGHDNLTNKDNNFWLTLFFYISQQSMTKLKIFQPSQPWTDNIRYFNS